MPERVPEELSGRNVNVSEDEWVCYFDEDSDQLQALLANLLQGAPG